MWTLLLVAAVLWPSRLAGLLDGAPLDTPLEVVAIGLLLAWLLVTDRQWLTRPLARTLVVGLLMKSGSSSRLPPALNPPEPDQGAPLTSE